MVLVIMHTNGTISTFAYPCHYFLEALRRVTSFPDSTPHRTAFIHSAIKSWGVESGNETREKKVCLVFNFAMKGHRNFYSQLHYCIVYLRPQFVDH